MQFSITRNSFVVVGESIKAGPIKRELLPWTSDRLDNHRRRGELLVILVVLEMKTVSTIARSS